MKILLVNWRDIKNPEMGGAEIHLHEIFKIIAKKGNEVVQVSHAFGNSPKEEIIDGIKIIRIGNKYLFDKQFKRFYLKNLANEKFDLIVDDISKIPLEIPKYAKIPVVAIIHHIHGKSLYREIAFPLAKYIIWKEQKIPKSYSKTQFFTVSESTKNELIQLGIESSKIDFLYNGINHTIFENTKVEKSEFPLISYIGRIKKYKQIEKIIDALPLVLEKFPNMIFVIGGKGDNLNNLENLVKMKNLEGNVKFLGFLSEQEKAKYLGKSWIFVTLAMKEGWGITVIEANAMKTPVIGANVEGLRDSIQNGKTGFLVNSEDKKEVAEKIIQLLENKRLRDELSENAFVWSKNFTWEKSADNFLEKIQSIL